MIVLEIFKSFRRNFEFQTIISLKKNLKSKTFKLYFNDIQKFFDRWIKKCANEFDFKSNIYQFDKTKILFVFDYLIETVFNDWHRHKKIVDTTAYTWKIFVSFLQKHLKSLHMRFTEIDQKLKHVCCDERRSMWYVIKADPIYVIQVSYICYSRPDNAFHLFNDECALEDA